MYSSAQRKILASPNTQSNYGYCCGSELFPTSTQHYFKFKTRRENARSCFESDFKSLSPLEFGDFYRLANAEGIGEPKVLQHFQCFSGLLTGITGGIHESFKWVGTQCEIRFWISQSQGDCMETYCEMTLWLPSPVAYAIKAFKAML